MKNFLLHGGDALPAMGLGTWRADPGIVGAAVREALAVGYRHIDCASVYGNEAEIGPALASSSLQRGEFWVTSKLWNNAHAPEHVRPALERSLADLRLEHLDLYLIHWPVRLRPEVLYPQRGTDLLPWDGGTLRETWAALEDCLSAGLVRNLGVSNFSCGKLQLLLDTCSIRPVVNQVELHPYLQQWPLKSFCDRQGIVLTGFAPLGSKHRPAHQVKPDEPVLLKSPVIQSIADKHQAAPAQVLLAWGITRGTAVIPKSVNPQRMRQNFAATSLRLDNADMEVIRTLDLRYRYLDGSHWVMDASPYTLENIWG